MVACRTPRAGGQPRVPRLPRRRRGLAYGRLVPRMGRPRVEGWAYHLPYRPDFLRVVAEGHHWLMAVRWRRCLSRHPREATFCECGLRHCVAGGKPRLLTLLASCTLANAPASSRDGSAQRGPARSTCCTKCRKLRAAGHRLRGDHSPRQTARRVRLVWERWRH